MSRIGRLALALALSAPLAPVAAAPERAPVASAASAFDERIDAAKKAMLTDPATALRLAREAGRLAGTVRDPGGVGIALASAQWLEGEALTRLNRVAEARPVLAAAVAAVERDGPNTKLHGDLVRAQGTTDALTGAVQAALRDFQRAHDIYRAASEPRGQAMALQNIGALYTDAGDYRSVLRYYEQSAEVFAGDPVLTLTAHNNLGRAYRGLGRFAEAEAQLRRGLAIAREIGSPVLEGALLENLASAQVDAGHLDAAEASLARARSILARDAGAGSPSVLWGVAAQAALKRGDVVRAEQYIRRTFADPTGGEDALNYREFHRTAYDIHKRLGNEAEALEHFEAFKALDDKARAVAASAAGQLMTARFDFANQDLKIERLRTEQLEREAAFNAAQSRTQRHIFIGFTGAAIVLVSVLLVGFFSIRRSRNQTRDANVALSGAYAALEKASNAKTEFLATTSHEIRTPLNGILGMTQVILADRTVEAGVHEKIKLVQGAGETMRALVDDILDIAKMETGNLTLEPHEMRLHRLLDDAVALWRDQAVAKGIIVEAAITDVPDRIVQDEAKLRQVVFNLMSNAVKFTASGSVRLSAATGVAPDGGETLVLAVRDSGIGIPEDQFACIFESFRQVDGGTSRRFGGSGLGLAICRNIALAMGGDIAVESRLGEGSTFILSMPLVRAETHVGGEAGPEEEAPSAILLVEANPLTRSVLGAVLKGGFEKIEVVVGWREALERLEAQRFAAVLMDAATAAEGGDAPGAVRAVAAAARGGPVSLLAQAPSAEDRIVLIAAGAAQVIAKPVAGKALLEALASVGALDPARAAA